MQGIKGDLFVEQCVALKKLCSRQGTGKVYVLGHCMDKWGAGRQRLVSGRNKVGFVGESKVLYVLGLSCGLMRADISDRWPHRDEGAGTPAWEKHLNGHLALL